MNHTTRRVGQTQVVRVLVFVCRFYEAHGRGPMYEDIMEGLGMSRQVVHKYLRRLRDDGYVTWEIGRQGTLRPLVTEVPVGNRH